uniref:Uncharacterized protein n=1 Tax=Arundo donax TaxID=35708 RepID=A0A0A9HUE7_ARUDO
MAVITAWRERAR